MYLPSCTNQKHYVDICVFDICIGSNLEISKELIMNLFPYIVFNSDLVTQYNTCLCVENKNCSLPVGNWFFSHFPPTVLHTKLDLFYPDVVLPKDTAELFFGQHAQIIPVIDF